jgi:hypothetical protein
MARWELSIDVDASPDAVWAIVGDPTAVPRFYPKYVGVEVEGNTRLLYSAEGAVLNERIVERNEAERWYEYSVISGAPVDEHLARFEVRERDGGGSTIVWRTEAEPSDPSADLEGRLTPTQQDALRRLKAIAEGRPPDA